MESSGKFQSIKQNTPKKSISFATFGSARHLRLHSPATGTTVESLADDLSRISGASHGETTIFSRG